MMRRTALLTAVAALVGAVVFGAPAQAADTLPLQFSADGVIWSDSMPEVVPDGWHPVPGSSHTTTVHVRSTRGSTSSVALYVSGAHSVSASLLAATSVSGGLAGVDLAAPDTCRALDATTLSPGGSGIFTVRVDVSPELADAERTDLSFDLVASMSDPDVAPVGPGCTPASAQTDSALPSTGGYAQNALLATLGGAVGIVVGVGMLRRRRREDV